MGALFLYTERGETMLTVRNLEGLEEPLADIYVTRNRKVNGEKTLTFMISPTKENQHAFNMVEEEAILTFDGEEYVIKKVSQRSVGKKYNKQITAIHKFFTDMIDSRQRNIHNGSLTFVNALKFIFDGTAYSYVVRDEFNAETFENFGGDNRLALLQTILERYQAEMEIVGPQVEFKRKVGNDTDFPFRYGHNIKTFSRDVDTSNLSTYIKGYGKKKEETDVLSGTKIPYESKSGTYFTHEGTNFLGTAKVGATFKFSFTGTGFNFDTAVHFLGGMWEFTIDNSQTVSISLYKDVDLEEKTFEIVRGLEHKKHNVTVKFTGTDPKNPYTKESDKDALTPQVYLKNGNCIGLYRELVGDESYQAVAEYTSPNAEIYGHRDAGDVVDERFTKKDSLLAEIKSRLQDTPEVSIAIDFVDLRAAGYPYTVPNEGDRVFTIYEPIEGLTLENRILEIDEEFRPSDVLPYYVPIRTKVTLANHKKSFSGTMMGTVQKALKSIVDSNGKVKSSVLDDAVLATTKALQSAQTEVEFTNGFLLRSKLDPNDLVIINSSGIGLSEDGGNSFGQAMTAGGFVADYITTGTLRAIIIEGVEIYGSLFESREDENGGENFIRITNNEFRSHGRYTRIWAEEEETALVNLGIRRGQMWISNEDTGYNLYITEKGLSTTMAGAIPGFSAGTLEFHSQRFNETSRGVTLHSTFGAVALVSDESRIITRSALTNNIESELAGVYVRPMIDVVPGINEFRFDVKVVNNGAETDGVLAYGNHTGAATLGSGIRYSKSGYPTVYATNLNGDYGTGNFAANAFVGGLEAPSDNAYAMVNDSLRVTSKSGYNNGNPSYRDIQARDIQSNSIRVHTDAARDFYIGVSSNELRVTNNLFYNGGDVGYKPVRASEFINASSIEYKTDVSVWDGDARSALLHETVVQQYKLIDDAGTERDLYRRGLIIEKETPAEFIYGKGTNLNEIVMFIIRAFQQEAELNNRRFMAIEEKLKESESA